MSNGEDYSKWWHEDSGGIGLTHAFEMELLHKEVSPFQKIEIFEHKTFGRILVLDGLIQAAQADEFIYHEMMAHVPIIAHGRAKRVLLIGGGDGGAVRRVLEHPVDRVVMVEIDRSVVDLSRQWLDSICGAAFDDPRLDLVIADGCTFVAETDERFDVIIVDSTDPIGPGAVLFTPEFYADCKRCLAPGGVLVNQSGTPFFQEQEFIDVQARLRQSFADVWAYAAAVPAYVGGQMAFGWATDDPTLRQVDMAEIARRIDAAGITGRYYSAEIHVGSFAMPGFLKALLPTD